MSFRRFSGIAFVILLGIILTLPLACKKKDNPTIPASADTATFTPTNATPSVSGTSTTSVTPISTNVFTISPTGTWSATPTATFSGDTPTTTYTVSATGTSTRTSTPAPTPTIPGTVLSAGDVVFVGVASKGNPQDNYAFVLLAPVSAGTTIFITDRSWDQTLNSGAGGLTSGEGLYCWTTNTNLPAYTVVKIGTDGDGQTPSVGTYVGSASSGIPTGLSSDGDQLIAFEGSVDYPYFVGAMNLKSAWQTSGSADKSHSYLPPGLTDGSTAMAWMGLNGYYDCSKGYSGTPAALRALILNTSNWIYLETNNLPSTFACDFNATPTFTPTITGTPTETSTSTASATPTDTWNDATFSPTPTITATPTDSPTVTETFTPTYTLTPVPTPTIPGTVLSAGDVVFTAYAYNGSPADNFAFTILAPVSAGTTIFITDGGWDSTKNNGAGSLVLANSKENIYGWTTSMDLPAGTVVEVGINGDGITPSVGISSNSVSLNLNFTDQLIAFEGSQAYPYFVGAMNTYAWITSGTVAANNSYLPPGLTDGSTAIAFTASEGNPVGYYNCASGTTGSAAELRALIFNSVNWTFSTSNGNIPSGMACSFSTP